MATTASHRLIYYGDSHENGANRENSCLMSGTPTRSPIGISFCCNWRVLVGYYQTIYGLLYLSGDMTEVWMLKQWKIIRNGCPHARVYEISVCYLNICTVYIIVTHIFGRNT